MKKSIFFMSLVLGLFVSIFALTACGSDDDDNGSSDELVGTVWRCINEDNYLIEVIVKTNTIAHVTIKQLDTGRVTDDSDYTYTYDAKAKKGTATNGKYTREFYVSGNKLSWTDEYGNTAILTKQ